MCLSKAWIPIFLSISTLSKKKSIKLDLSLKIVKKAAPKLVEDYSQITKLNMHIKNKLKKGNLYIDLIKLFENMKIDYTLDNMSYSF